MAKKQRSQPEETHESGEIEPCAECRAEIALLRRAQELKEQEGLEGRELVEGVLTSLQQEQDLEAMWRRRTRKSSTADASRGR